MTTPPKNPTTPILSLIAAQTTNSNTEHALLDALPRHRHNLSRDTIRVSQAARILIASAEVIARTGYANTRVQTIAEQAGVSRKTFYQLFKNKEDVFLTCYTAVAILIARITHATSQCNTLEKAIQVGTNTFLKNLASEPTFTHMLVIEAVGAGPRVLQRRSQAYQELAKILTNTLQKLSVTNPPLQPLDESLLLAMLGGINELVLQHLTHHSATSLPHLAPRIIHFIRRICFGTSSNIAS